MIEKKLIQFLQSLQKNNNRAWFEEHRGEYEYAKSSFLVFVEQVIKSISTFDPSVANLLAKDCTFRINRDVRFSKDKRPYKNNMSAYFNRAGKKGAGAGYYIHIEPGASFAAAGIWMPEPGDLAKIRQEIDYNLPEWKKIIQGAAFKKRFPGGLDQNESLQRPPKGYAEDNPAIAFLKMKHFVVRKSFTDAEIADKSFVKEVNKTFGALKPMIDFINRSLD
jgi:uncharacterized protein (TIGR02453 family)